MCLLRCPSDGVVPWMGGLASGGAFQYDGCNLSERKDQDLESLFKNEQYLVSDFFIILLFRIIPKNSLLQNLGASFVGSLCDEY